MSFVSGTDLTYEGGRHDITNLSPVFCLLSHVQMEHMRKEGMKSGICLQFLSFVSCTDGTHEEGRHDMVFLSFVSCTDLTYEEGRHETRNLSPVFVFCLMTDGTYEERRHD